MRPAAFIDRDGVINEPVWDPRTESCESPYSAADVALVPGAAAAMSALRDAGFALVIASNQPAAAKGTVPLAELRTVADRVEALLRAKDVELDGAFYCHHHPQGAVPELSGPCACRKPAPGLLLDAAERLDLDLGASWMIGDADTDVEAGRAAGVPAALVEHPRTAHRRGRSVRPDLTAPDLAAAARAIVASTAR
jgi:D-glycero-D-manno-heptose 1,7-bisphosphate phosphatase